MTALQKKPSAARNLFAAWLAVLLCSISAVAQIKPAAPQSLPELVLQTGHTWRLETIAFTKDSRLMASSSGSRGDGTVKLWEVSTHRQLRTIAGHADGVNAIAFSPDGRWLASGGEDDTIRIWEVETGNEVRRFYVPAEGVRFLLFSPDSRYLISLPQLSPFIGRDREPSGTQTPCPNVKDKPGFCEAKDLSVWDVQGGRFLFNIAPPRLKDPSRPSGYWHVLFSPDGKLSVGVDGNEMQLWDVAGRKQSVVLEGSAPPFVFDSKGRRIATVSPDGGVVIWDLVTHGKLARINQSSVPVAFANHDTRLITTTGKAGSEVIQIWNTADGHEVETLSPDPILGCANCSLHFSDDGRWVARGGFGEPKLILWDLDAPTKPPQTWWNLSAPIVFSPDGRWLGAVTAPYFNSKISSNNIWMLDLESGDQSCASASPLRKIAAVAVSATPPLLATASGTTVDIWDLATGVQTKTLRGDDEAISALRFSPDGHWLISGYRPSREAVTWMPGIANPGTVLPRIDWKEPQCLSIQSESDAKNQLTQDRGAVWDVTTGRPYRGWPQMLAPIAVSANSQQIASAYEGPVMNLWNLSDGTGKQLKETRPGTLMASGETSVRAIAFSPNHRWLALAMDDESNIALWDLDANRRISTLTGPTASPPRTVNERLQLDYTSNITSLAFNPISGILASVSEDGTIRRWKVEEAKEISSFHVEGGHRSELAFSNDGSRLAITIGNKVELWDVSAGVQMSSLEGQPNAVNGVAFSNDGKLLFTGSDDGTTRIWDANSGALLAMLVSLKGSGDWLVVTPDGLFDGTAPAWKQILWRFDHNTLHYAPVEAYFNDFFYPGLLQEIFEGKRPKPPEGKALVKRDRRRPTLKIESIKREGNSNAMPTQPTQDLSKDNRRLTIRVAVTDNTDSVANASHGRSSGAQDLRLFRNGSLVKLWAGDVFARNGKDGCKLQPRTARTPRQVICTTGVPIVAASNNFTAYAFNSDNVKSEDVTLSVTGADSLKRAGMLYVLSVGVNEYENKAFNLTYAVPDAEDFGAELRKQQENLKHYERTEIIPLYNNQATKEKILGVLKDLAARVQPEDAVVVYFAGHGTVGSCLSATTQQVNAKDRFYLVPYDLGYYGAIPDRCEQKLLDEVAHHSISDEELTRAFEGIDAGQLLLVIDACNSGQALESEETRRGPMNSRGLAQLAYEKGMYILTAAQSLQEAKADKKIAKGHGYLTYALVEEGLKTKAAADRDGNVLLREWVDYAVQRVPRMQQVEVAERRRLVKKQVSKTAKEEEEVQTPRVFYRREPDVKAMIVAKP
ncbi:MAG TPA: caspase family protein [Pyrinomonadaceae bacterium]|nr:caspase family protein [Pyrinomonadaceae bacterium]